MLLQPGQPPQRTFGGCPRNVVKGQSPKGFIEDIYKKAFYMFIYFIGKIL